MSQHELAERVVAECLERPEAEWAEAIEVACRRHVGMAPSIRKIYLALRAAGLANVRSAPQRLGEFLLLDAIGGGAMGDVFRARQTSVDRDVALKIVRSEARFLPDTAERFRREIAAIATLQHPGVVKILSCGVEGDVPYYAMELLDGMTLAEVLSKLRARSVGEPVGSDLAEALGVHPSVFPGGWVETCFRIVARVAAALAHVHEHRILHRDIKPANIMLTRAGEPVIIDFGLARGDDDPGLTRSGARLGSLPYLAPELWRSAAEHDARTEVYALGLVLWEMLALRPTFVGKSEEDLREAVLTGRVPGLRSLQRAVSPDAETVCLCAIDVEPARRYRGCAELGRDLANVIALRPIAARRPGRVRSWWRAAARRPALTTALGLLLVVIVLGALVLAMGWAARRTARDQEMKDRRLDAKWATDVLTFLQARNDADLWPIGPDKAPSYEFWGLQAKDLLAYMADAKLRCDRDRHRFVQPQSPLGPAERGAAFFPEADAELDRDHGTYLAERTALSAMGALERSIHLMDRCLEIGQRVGQMSLASASIEEAWSSACDHASSSGSYPGLDLSPQAGLVPLGFDPATGRLLFWHVASGTRPDPEAGRTCSTDPDVGLVFELMPPPASGDPPFFIAQQPMTYAIWARLGWSVPDSRDRDTAPITDVAFLEVELVLRRMGLVAPTPAQWRSRFTDGRLPAGMHEWCAQGSEQSEVRSIMPDGVRFAGLPAGEQPPRGYRHAGVGIRGVRLLHAVSTDRVVQYERRFTAAAFDGWICGATGGKESGGAWTLRSSGGNPEACLETVTFSGQAFLFFLHPEATWDPREAEPWTDLDMEVECRTLSRWGLGEVVMPIIEQGGAVFFGFDRGLVTGRIREWHKATVAGYRPSDFLRVMPYDWERDPSLYELSGSARPDTGPAAKPMRFGFGILSRLNGVYRQVFDNFSLTVRRRVAK